MNFVGYLLATRNEGLMSIVSSPRLFFLQVVCVTSFLAIIPLQVVDAQTATVTANCPSTFTLDFDTDAEGNPTSAGDLAADISWPFDVTITSAASENYPAMLFDADNPTGNDFDLESPGQGMVLIISEDGDVNDPDDYARGGTLVFDFAGAASQPVTVKEIGVLDLEESAEGMIKIYDTSDTLLVDDLLPMTGDGALGRMSLQDVENVARMEIILTGSGAITNITFCVVGSSESEVSAPRDNLLFDDDDDFLVLSATDSDLDDNDGIIPPLQATTTAVAQQQQDKEGMDNMTTWNYTAFDFDYEDMMEENGNSTNKTCDSIDWATEDTSCDFELLLDGVCQHNNNQNNDSNNSSSGCAASVAGSSDCFDCDPCQHYSDTNCETCTTNNEDAAACFWCAGDARCLSQPLDQGFFDVFNKVTSCPSIKDWMTTCSSDTTTTTTTGIEEVATAVGKTENP